MAYILILEDDYDQASSWRRALQYAGHEVDLAYNSAEAIAMTQSRDYDMFVVDLLLQKNIDDVRDTGREFLRQFLTFGAERLSPESFIGVTGFRPLNRDGVGRSIFELYGVRKILFKPFEPQALVDMVARSTK